MLMAPMPMLSPRFPIRCGGTGGSGPQAIIRDGTRGITVLIMPDGTMTMGGTGILITITRTIRTMHTTTIGRCITTATVPADSMATV